jgi:hypothetical protein
MSKTSETIGSWGCASCRPTVHDRNTGPCILCGGATGQIVPAGLGREVVTVPAPLSQAVQRTAPKPTRNLLAIIAAACLCIGSPWNVATLLWDLSLSCYGLARVRARAYPLPG